MIKKLTLTKVYRATTKKDGTSLLTKDGRPYTKIALKAVEYGEKWLNGFGNNFNKNWREGDVVEVEIEINGEYLNFKGLTPEARFEARIAELEKKVAALSVPKAKQVEDEYDHAEKMPSEDGTGIDTDDIPF